MLRDASEERDKKQDREASQFAMCLLMPEPMLRRSVESLDRAALDEDDVTRLAAQYQVSLGVMYVRLIQLGVPIAA